MGDCNEQMGECREEDPHHDKTERIHLKEVTRLSAGVAARQGYAGLVCSGQGNHPVKKGKTFQPISRGTGGLG